MTSKRFWIIAYPDLIKPIGGIKQLHRISEILSSLGFSSYLIQDSISFHPSWFSSNVKTISKDEFFNNVTLDPLFDVLILPETYVPIVHTIVDVSIPRIIFNQNSSYTFGIKASHFYKPSVISSLYSLPSIKQVWCVSHQDRRFLMRSFSLSPDRVRLITNALDLPSTSLNVAKKRQIVYMPRKNAEDSSIVLNLLNNSELASSWSVKPIINVSHEKVIELMQESLIFLSFGFPEGFGLPVAEAMACGCAVIGYDGLGGRELFHHADQYPGLAYSIQYGDWYAFIEAIGLVDRNLRMFESEFLSNLQMHSNYIREKYCHSAMKADVHSALSILS